MSTQWNTKSIGKNLDLMQNGLLEEEIVILLNGKNSFGNRIYSFLKLKLKDAMRIHTAIQEGEQFNPSDYGTVVAAGTGDPPDDVRMEIASQYKFVNTTRGIVPADTVKLEEKPWDEY